MACFHPQIAAWYKPDFQATRPGGFTRPIFLGEYRGLDVDYSASLRLPPDICDKMMFYQIPCGKCLGCRAQNAAQWKFRAMAELDEHSISAFITLTVDDNCMEQVFPSKRLRHRFFQLWLKKLRKMISPLKIRYLMCGEYGTNTLRPHYHAIIFGWFPEDYAFWADRGSYQIFVSPSLSRLWPYGFSTVTLANESTIQYLVGYVMKKVDVPFPEGAPPYIRASTRPGLGYAFFDKYKNEIFAKSSNLTYPNLYVYCGSSKIAVPRYFVRKYAEGAYNVDYVSLMNYRLSKKSLQKPLDKSDLQRLEDYFREVTKWSHNSRLLEV